MKKFFKVSIITLSIIAIVCVAVFFARQNKQKKRITKVQPITYYTITEWSDSIESSSEIKSNGAQAVYLPADTKILDIYVNEGDIVSEGDPLIMLDKIDSSITIRDKELKIKQAQLNLKLANARLAQAQKTKVAPDAEKITIKTEYDDYKDIFKEIFYDEAGNWLGENTFDEGTLIDEYNPDKGVSLDQKESMIFERTIAVQNADLTVRILQQELNVLKDSAESGEIVAKCDGIVTKLCSADNIPKDGSAFLILSSSDGYYVTGQVSELNLLDVVPGTSVTVNNWMSGASTTATITEIDSYPASNSNSYSSGGNSNVTYYNYKATLDDMTGMELGNYVDVNLNLSADEDTVYIYNPFIRTENGKSYLMIMDENGKLKQQFVTCGEQLWGSYTKITSGYPGDDAYISFPYGPEAVIGSTCEIDDNANW